MRALALRGFPRRLLTRLHRWSGLAALVFLLIAAITGTWLSFRHELDRLINPELRVVQPQAKRVPLDDISRRLERRFEAAAVTTIVLQEHPDDALVVYLGSKSGGELPFDQVYVDPYTGEILGQRSTSRLTLTKASLDPFMLGLHYNLLLGRPGLFLMGGVACVWLVTSLIGLALSWPHASRRLVGWRPIITVRSRSGAYKVNYDLHRAIGVVLFPVLTVMAFTSIYLNLPQIVTPAVRMFSPLSSRPVRTPYRPGDPMIGADAAIARALSVVTGGRVSSIYRDLRASWYSVLIHREGDVSSTGDHFVYVDLRTGEIAATRLGDAATAGERFLMWQFPLHSGLAFGRSGQVAVAVAGASIVTLGVTGFYVWWRKWLARRKPRASTALAPVFHALESSGSQPRAAASRHP